MITKEDLEEDSIYHYYYEFEIRGIGHVFDFLCTYDKDETSRTKRYTGNMFRFNIISKSPETKWNLAYFALHEHDFQYMTKLS